MLIDYANALDSKVLKYISEHDDSADFEELCASLETDGYGRVDVGRSILRLEEAGKITFETGSDIQLSDGNAVPA